MQVWKEVLLDILSRTPSLEIENNLYHLLTRTWPFAPSKEFPPKHTRCSLPEVTEQDEIYPGLNAVVQLLSYPSSAKKGVMTFPQPLPLPL